MIFITVKSDLQETKRQFETDKEAEKYLKDVNKTHQNYREYLYKKQNAPTIGRRFPNGTVSKKTFMQTCLRLSVSIHNTDSAQYNLKTELK